MIELGHVEFPFTAGNLLQMVATAPVPPADSALKWRVRCIRPPAVNFTRPSSLPYYLTFGIANIYAQWFPNSGAVQSAVGTVTTMEAAGFPAIGELVDLLGEWNPTTDTLSLHWRDPAGHSIDLGSDDDWVLAASHVAAGQTSHLTYPHWFMSGTVDGTDLMDGPVYRWMLHHNDVLVADVNPDVDITEANKDDATLTASTAQTVTVFRAGDPHTELVPTVRAFSVATKERRPLWGLDLCRGWERIGMAEAFSFSGVIRRNAMGDFTLDTTPSGLVGGRRFDPSLGEAGEYVDFDPRDVDSIRLVAEGQVVMSCYPGGPNEGAGLKVIRDATGTVLQWTGVDAWWDLAGRLAFPNPAIEPPWAVTHDVQTGQASAVIAAYLNHNAGVLAQAERQTPIAITDDAVGGSQQWSARLQTLAELAARIAADGSIEVYPEVGFDGILRVLLTQARDLSDFIVLSDQGDLSRSEATFMPERASYTLTGGGGQGTARLFAVSDTGATGRARREQFSDQNGYTSAAEVASDAQHKTALAAPSEALVTDLSPMMASLAIKLGLRLGDRLSVIVDGRRYRLPIEAVQFEVTPERSVMRPVLGTADVDSFQTILKRVDNLNPMFENAIA